MTEPLFLIGPRVETSDGVEIATYDLGGEGPPMLLAHATSFHGRIWLPVAAGLRDQFHCWSFDARGHGDSGRPRDGQYDWNAFGRDVRAVVRALGFKQPRAVGHSLGGAALLLAEEAEPGTFCALYCYEPVIPLPPMVAVTSREGNPLSAGARRRREDFSSRAAALENFSRKPPFSTFDPAALEAYVEWGFHDQPDGSVRLACHREDEARIYEQAVHHRGFDDLPLVTCPVIMASGGVDAHFGEDVSQALVERLGGPGAVEVLPDVGHFGPLERPSEVAASIGRVLDPAFGTMGSGGSRG